MEKGEKTKNQFEELSQAGFEVGILKAGNYLRKQGLTEKYAIIRSALFELADEIAKLTK